MNTSLASSASAEEIIAEYETSRSDGLEETEVKKRLNEYGPNQLRKIEQKTPWDILLNQFKSLIVLLLVTASVVSLAFGQWVEALAILVVIIINAGIGFVTELRAVRSMEALRELGQVTSKVRRDGEIVEVPAQQLVPGDIVILEGGDIVTADLRLIEASKLQCDESTLTGESLPVDKDVNPLPQHPPLAERKNMAFKGTAVTRGSGEGVIIATGMDTELGEISSLVEEAEDTATPLEQKLAQLGHRLIWVTLAITALVAGAGIAAGRDLFLMIETAIALAVAAIPEGLPIVATLALARGMWRMARRNALINRLSAVETLGGTDVILTDKTGTLTENKMTVKRVVVDSLQVEFNGSTPEDSTVKDWKSLTENEKGTLREALEIGTLCNNASLGDNDPRGERKAVGDPLEVSLLEVGRKIGIDRKTLRGRIPEVREVAFDADSKLMATYHKKNGTYRIAVKGAPESVLEKSTGVKTPSGIAELTPSMRENYLEKNEQMAAEGLRMLALADKEVDSEEADPYSELIFRGLVGMTDPPREEVREAIERCRKAGIRVVMVTGDQPVTAKQIGIAVGLAEDSTEIISSGELKPYDQLSSEEKKRYLDSSLFARVSPKQKLDLITLHQENRSVVAMTGDGVNDAPALKKADIGIAMGLRGTQVAQQAADMILKDDRFSSIVSAIEGGRVIFSNIRSFVRYLLSCNISEIMAVAIASFAGLPLPLLPLQILFLNLVTDVFPALALGFGEGGPLVMQKPPRSRDEPILNRERWLGIGGYGLLITAAVLGSLQVATVQFDFDPSRAVSVSFLTLALAQLWHVFNMRDPQSNPVLNHITRNRYIWFALLFCVVLLFTATYVPLLAKILSVTPPGPIGWVLIFSFSLGPLIVGQTVHLLRSIR